MAENGSQGGSKRFLLFGPGYMGIEPFGSAARISNSKYRKPVSRQPAAPVKKSGTDAAAGLKEKVMQLSEAEDGKAARLEGFRGLG